MDDAEKERLAQEVLDEYRNIAREYMAARQIVLSRFDGAKYWPVEIDAALIEIGMLVNNQRKKNTQNDSAQGNERGKPLSGTSLLAAVFAGRYRLASEPTPNFCICVVWNRLDQMKRRETAGITSGLSPS